VSQARTIYIELNVNEHWTRMAEGPYHDLGKAKERMRELASLHGWSWLRLVDDGGSMIVW